MLLCFYISLLNYFFGYCFLENFDIIGQQFVGLVIMGLLANLHKKEESHHDIR